MNDNTNEDYSQEMEEHNLLLHDKSEAFKKLAKALYDKSQRLLNPPLMMMKKPIKRNQKIN